VVVGRRIESSFGPSTHGYRGARGGLGSVPRVAYGPARQPANDDDNRSCVKPDCGLVLMFHMSGWRSDKSSYEALNIKHIQLVISDSSCIG
ncbi:MAG TPA: hypothetical protein PKD25_14730, partial [Rubrivivax sp.]|nr:hypothetical protein [Rubrivivax sp.]